MRYLNSLTMHITFKLKKKKKTLIPGRFLHKLMLDRYMV